MAGRQAKIDGNCDEILAELASMGSPVNVEGMARFGIRPQTTLVHGISITALRSYAKRFDKSHALALDLWRSEVFEARLLATLLDVATEVTPEQMDAWVADIDTWDLCDQLCSNLFDKTPYVDQKAHAWTARSEEYVRRAGFVIIATSAIHNKKADDTWFIDFLPTLVAGMTDERNLVKKAVSWSFRQIGKRNADLSSEVLAVVRPHADDNNKTVRWIARDVIKDLEATMLRR